MDITQTVVLPSVGGALIGAAAAGMMLFNGRIAGISGILGGMLGSPTSELKWRAAFMLGLLAGGGLLLALYPQAFPTESIRSTPALIAAGLLVGFGTRLGSGCTSGHGVCGISRFSKRSILATVTFMFTGAVAVAIVRYAFGGVI